MKNRYGINYSIDDFIKIINSLSKYYKKEYLITDKNSPEYNFFKKSYKVLINFYHRLQTDKYINTFNDIKYSVAYILFNDPLYENLIKKIKQSKNNSNLYYLSIINEHKICFNSLVDIMEEYKKNKLNINNLNNQRYSSNIYNSIVSLIGIIGLTSVICSIGSLSSNNINYFKTDNLTYNISFLLTGTILLAISIFFLYRDEFKSIKEEMEDFETIINTDDLNKFSLN